MSTAFEAKYPPKRRLSNIDIKAIDRRTKRLHGRESVKTSNTWRCGSFLDEGGKETAADRPPLTICVLREARYKQAWTTLDQKPMWCVGFAVAISQTEAISKGFCRNAAERQDKTEAVFSLSARRMQDGEASIAHQGGRGGDQGYARSGAGPKKLALMSSPV